MISNEELYSNFINGDELAFKELMEKLGDPLVFYIYGYTKDFCEAEDLMIEAFSNLIAKKPHIKNGAFKAYLYKIARNLALRSLEKSKRFFSYDLDSVVDLSDEKMLVDSITDTNEKYQILHLCLDKLTPDYREVIYLVYFEGLSHKQVAQIMRKRERQVSDLVFRAKKSLKTKLEKEGITYA